MNVFIFLVNLGGILFAVSLASRAWYDGLRTVQIKELIVAILLLIIGVALMGYWI